MSDDPVLLITGASSGIGAATARHAAEADWRLVLAARSEDKLESLAAELGSERAVPVRCDVTSWEDQQAAVAAALDSFGRLDAPFPLPIPRRGPSSSRVLAIMRWWAAWYSSGVLALIHSSSSSRTRASFSPFLRRSAGATSIRSRERFGRGSTPLAVGPSSS
jgi:nucleoside-diphosphate-sugar epimerase